MDTFPFIRQFPVKSFRKGEMILYEGDSTESIYAISNGFVKVTSLSESGQERILWIAGPGNYIPAEQLFEPQGFLLFFYTALSDCELYKIKKTYFIEFTRTRLELMSEIAHRLSTHYDDLLLQVDSVGQVSVRNKLIYMLCYLARRFSTNDILDIYSIDLRLTQKDLADMVGSSRETTSLELHKLMLDGGIVYDRTKFIINVSKLENL
jgi:CRP/FNR family transcriptional regulator